jgi:GTP pyrophosphokinase
MDEVLEKYLALEEKVKGYNPGLNVDRMRAALEFSRTAHGDQKRLDGSPFITHPIAAADITADMGLDEDAVIACLLHDSIEDTGVTYEDIAKKFGTTVADIVEGVTKLTRVVYTSKEEEQVENLRKMLMAMAKDIRVILIKIADRLHNLRTLNYQSQSKQREKALESIEIYAPIAHRLGIQRAKWELEDLSLVYIDPIGYKEITAQIDSRRESLEAFMNAVRSRISARMESYNIKATVSSRLKHIYSIYRKMYSQNKDLSEVFDLCAFRVIVDSISDCYNVLGHMHDLFKPIPENSRTISVPPSQICIKASTRPSSDRKASPLRFRSGPGKCIILPNTALRPIGNTSPKSPATINPKRKNTPGSGAFWSRSRIPTPMILFRSSRSTCLPTRSLCSHPRAT